MARDNKKASGKLRACVIGAGAMGKNHVRIYSDMDNIEFCAISDVNEKELEKLGRKYNVNTYTDYKKMLEIEVPDIVSIVVPTNMHHKVATDCLNAKANVLLEKPIASTIAEAKDIIAAAEKSKVKLMIGHIERFNPAVQELKRLIREGELGKVYEIVVKRIGPFPARIRDVGVVIDLAVHDLDIMRYILDSEPERLYAETEKRIHTEHEDLMLAMLKFKSSVVCNLHINWLTPTKKRKIYVTGEKGMFAVDYITQDLVYYENASKDKNGNGKDDMFLITEGRMIRCVVPKKEPLRAELEHFVSCVEEDKDPLVSGKDGMIALSLAKKIIESADRNEVLKNDD